MARVETGWVKVHRKMVRSEFRTDPYSYALWIDLFLTANFDDTTMKLGRRTVRIKRGQKLTSVAEIANDLGMDWRTAKDRLNYLRDRGSIRFENVITRQNRGVLITILNFEKYQCRDDKNPESEVERHEQRHEQRRAYLKRNKEGKECKEEISISPESPPAPQEAAYRPTKKSPTKNPKKVSDQDMELRRSTWSAYAEAYKRRYGIEPLRGASVNANIAKLCSIVGKDTPSVAAYYLTLSDKFYQGHPIGLCLKDAQKIYTNWKTGRTAWDGMDPVAAEQARFKEGVLDVTGLS